MDCCSDLAVPQLRGAASEARRRRLTWELKAQGAMLVVASVRRATRRLCLCGCCLGSAPDTRVFASHCAALAGAAFGAEAECRITGGMVGLLVG